MPFLAPPALLQTMATEADLEDEFQAFLAEVEQLAIDDEPTSEVDALNASTIDVPLHEDVAGENHNSTSSHTLKSTPHNISSTDDTASKQKAKKEKNNLISKATNNQRVWTEFLKEDSKETTSTAGDDSSEPKISFQIKGTTSKTKKKKLKLKASAQQQSHPQPSFESQDEICPRWLLVIDTCCLLDDKGMAIQRLIDIASHVSNTQYRAQQQHEQSSGRNTALVASTIDEPIEIVIPYKVWTELEYQSKSDDASLAFAARSVMRMLREELNRNSTQSQAHVVRSQSLKESREAATKFLSIDSTSTPTNDDHILACALAEHERTNSDGKNTLAGGVIVVSKDNNLACKSLANGLKVYCPNSFLDYYTKRMDSLRQRVTDMTNASRPFNHRQYTRQ